MINHEVVDPKLVRRLRDARSLDNTVTTVCLCTTSPHIGEDSSFSFITAFVDVGIDHRDNVMYDDSDYQFRIYRYSYFNSVRSMAVVSADVSVLSDDELRPVTSGNDGVGLGHAVQQFCADYHGL